MALRTLVVDMDEALEEGLELCFMCRRHGSLTFTGG